MIQRWIYIAGVSLMPGVFAGAFLAMAWVRSQQGHTEHYRSEIKSLAIRTESDDPLADTRERGGEVYQHYCQICHGKEGKGDGFNSFNLDPPPRNLTDKEFWRQTPDERIYYAVAQGGASVGKSLLMPAWGHTLTEKEIRDVIVFLHAFAEQPEAETPAE